VNDGVDPTPATGQHLVQEVAAVVVGLAEETPSVELEAVEDDVRHGIARTDARSRLRRLGPMFRPVLGQIRVGRLRSTAGSLLPCRRGHLADIGTVRREPEMEVTPRP
jgi:hypothetical protein